MLLLIPRAPSLPFGLRGLGWLAGWLTLALASGLAPHPLSAEPASLPGQPASSPLSPPGDPFPPSPLGAQPTPLSNQPPPFPSQRSPIEELAAEAFTPTTTVRVDVNAVTGALHYEGRAVERGANTAAGFPLLNAWTLNHDSRLTLDTSFTGQDLFRVRLRSGN